ncbi:putative RNA recognition motif domain containing protein [Monocercomonoides exilis]|uniref:putative RNA recognition motif domain containing protein n=1 Tax=Monocercomonoides exilis TaxID=2049356 RepID=UPI003559C5FE|nr:putative RNA recognition motif domain containing protein [Monocercomonoides exilis]|eukprot:MONOS_10765.1-p1 / transcript=MONOS_10765.1 / gene=MONOS_10765 / organism=Monocercomonoides_exilis_PA203 / gene_product=RNA recognition motif domain containing protein / transcript_product=RNA recognition motif domain containing protein / location=Mono_scaffold00503:26047-27908(-) / protein_length=501 / sequence_SO=supercontig / SO=protein_coding / is_pseudo=false
MDSEEESEDFDEENKRILEEDLKKLDDEEGYSEDDISEEENESDNDDDESDASNDEEQGEKRQRRKSHFDPEKNKRTIFIGNIPITMTEKDIRKIVLPYGHIESIRFRSVPVDNEAKLPKKAAVIKKAFNKELDVKNCYVVFRTEGDSQTAVEQLSSPEQKQKLGGSLVRITHANTKDVDFKRSVFVGQLPFNLKESELLRHFESCGAVRSVRIIRDKWTRQGKGFGFVTFEDADSVTASMALDGSELGDRTIRVTKAMHPKKAGKLKNKLKIEKEEKRAKEKERNKKRREQQRRREAGVATKTVKKKERWRDRGKVREKQSDEGEEGEDEGEGEGGNEEKARKTSFKERKGGDGKESKSEFKKRDRDNRGTKTRKGEGEEGEGEVAHTSNVSQRGRKAMKTGTESTSSSSSSSAAPSALVHSMAGAKTEKPTFSRFFEGLHAKRGDAQLDLDGAVVKKSRKRMNAFEKMEKERKKAKKIEKERKQKRKEKKEKKERKRKQ